MTMIGGSSGGAVAGEGWEEEVALDAFAGDLRRR